MDWSRRFASFLSVLLLTSLPAAADIWQPAGPEGGVVADLVDVPGDSLTVYAALEEGGVFKTTDAGVSWRPVNEGLAGAAVYTLAHHPVVDDILYAGTSKGVFRTIDGGEHWAAVNNGLPVSSLYRVNALAVTSSGIYANFAHNVNPALQQGLFVSQDAGESWTRTDLGIGNSPIYDLAADLFTPETLYVATRGAGVIRTQDGGATWLPSGRGLSTLRQVRALAVSPSSRQVLYALVHEGGVFKSTNGGERWQRINQGLPHFVITALTVHPSNPAIVYAGTLIGELYQTTNGGVSWQRLSPGFPSREVRSLLVDSDDPRLLFAGLQGSGVFKSANAGAAWAPANRNLRAVPSSRVLADPKRPGFLFASADQNVVKTQDGGASWRVVGEGLVYLPLAIHPERPATVYAAGPNRLMRTVNGGRTWSRVDIGFLQQGTNVISFAIDPSDPSRLYLGSINTFKNSDDGGVTWTNRPLVCQTPLFLEVTPSSDLFAGMTSDCGPVPAGLGIFKREAGSTAFLPVNGGLPLRPRPTGLGVDPREPSTVYVGIHGFLNEGGSLREVRRVYRTTDSGATWSFIAGLGDEQHDAKAFAFPLKEPGVVYAALDGLGIFVSRDGGESWTPVNEGLQSYKVLSLGFDAGSPETLYAATLGGIFKLVRTPTAGHSVP